MGLIFIFIILKAINPRDAVNARRQKDDPIEKPIRTEL